MRTAGINLMQALKSLSQQMQLITHTHTHCIGNGLHLFDSFFTTQSPSLCSPSLPIYLHFPSRLIYIRFLLLFPLLTAYLLAQSIRSCLDGFRSMLHVCMHASECLVCAHECVCVNILALNSGLAPID